MGFSLFHRVFGCWYVHAAQTLSDGNFNSNANLTMHYGLDARDRAHCFLTVVFFCRYGKLAPTLEPTSQLRGRGIGTKLIKTPDTFCVCIPNLRHYDMLTFTRPGWAVLAWCEILLETIV